jgi:transglutaminase-like putative cysteine protease
MKLKHALRGPAVCCLAALATLLWAMPVLAVIEGPELLRSDEAARMIAEADASPYEGADRLVIFDRTQVEVEETGLSHVYNHRLIKVLEYEGARAMRALRFDYDPASNLIAIRAVRVHRSDSTFYDVDPADAVDVTAPASGIYWGARMLALALPALEPDDAVEIITYKKGFQIAYLEGEESGSSGDGGGGEDEERYIPPMRGHFYDVVTFQGNLPLLEKTYTVHMPKDKPLQYSLYNGEVMSSLRFGKDHLIYSFWKEDVPAVDHEARMPDLSDVVPKAVMATVPDWPEKSRWFFEANEWVFASNPDIDAMVEGITAGLRTDEEKIAALVHWVAQNIRYSGLNMGEGEGYTIHPGAMTFRDRCGVCKDIAGMLVTMLRAAGFETFAAMTMAGARVEEIPADQFNHCVVALVQEDGEYLMLDPTWAPWNRPVWSRWEGEQHYVIGSPEGEDLCAIRPFEAEENLLEIESDARILPDGTLEGDFRMWGKGISDGRIRSVAAYNPKRYIKRYLEGWLSEISERAELVDLSLSDHRDFAHDATMSLSYRVPRFADLMEEDLIFRSPALLLVADNSRLARILGMPDDEDREYPVFMWAPQKVEITESVLLPRDYEAEEPEDWEKQESLASGSLTWEPKGSRLDLKGHLSLDQRLIPREDFAGVRDVAEEFRDEAEAQLYAVR